MTYESSVSVHLTSWLSDILHFLKGYPSYFSCIPIAVVFQRINCPVTTHNLWKAGMSIAKPLFTLILFTGQQNQNTEPGQLVAVIWCSSKCAQPEIHVRCLLMRGLAQTQNNMGQWPHWQCFCRPLESSVF